MPSFQEVSKQEWDYMKGKFEYTFKSELPTNTFKDTYIKFLTNDLEVMGKEREYYSPKRYRYFLWR